MKEKYFPHLFSPLKVGNVYWKNRIQTGPMSMTELGPDETLGAENIAFYESLARGGAAVVTIGESIIRSNNGKTHTQQIIIGEKTLPSLTCAADVIHAHGAVANIEISHGGIMADPLYNKGNRLMGPVGLFDDYAGEVIGMDEAMMNDVADAFGEAALDVKRCGFDMAMIHAGHGWLLSQFLSPLYNTRKDEYGGSAENRNRFPLMVLKRVRDRVGRSFTLDMRVSGSEFLEGGAEIEDCVAFCAEAQNYVDIINVSAGAPWTKRMVPSVFEERGVNAVFAAAVKQAVDIPVTTVGGFADPAHMERVIAEGGADGIVLGRGIVADPQLPNKARRGKSDFIHKCIRCFVCNEALYSTRNLRCSINPAAGRELMANGNSVSNPGFAANPAANSARAGKILVAGGGPGGMTAAITAARRGFDVVLYEKSDTLGGALKIDAHIPFKNDITEYCASLVAELADAGVVVRRGEALTPEIAKAQNADAVIAALGARPLIPSIPGIDGENVVLAENVFTQEISPTSRILVIGGGLVGAEIGLCFAKKGHVVTIVEMRDGIAVDATPDYRRFLLAEIENEDNMEMKTETRCVAVTKGGVMCRTNDGEETEYGADIVILAAGYTALTDEAEALRGSAPEFRAIGDCVKAGRICAAVRAGYDAGLFIL
jgi:2,4-dienoyl-CoA reductase-like NADH-dependent reductase (Old Yellow Enzyme family)/thioredoxin reductase